jgi:Delta7-sterol 5-desaturase
MPMHGPFLGVWVTSLAFDAGRYIIAAGAAFLVFWVWRKERWRHRLVQGEYPRSSQVRREIAYSASTVVIFSLVGAGLWFGGKAGVFRLYLRVAEHGWAYFGLTVVAMIVLQDAYFYFTHRAMHLPFFFKHVHRVHHRSTNPSPFAAYAFSPAEAIVHAAYVPLFALFVPVHEIAIFLFLAFMITRNVLGHLGIELFPRWFTRSRWSRWSTTTTHHCLHHRRVGSNYGLYFTWWDRLMGTTDPSYEKTFEAVSSK